MSTSRERIRQASGVGARHLRRAVRDMVASGYKRCGSHEVLLKSASEAEVGSGVYFTSAVAKPANARFPSLSCPRVC